MEFHEITCQSACNIIKNGRLPYRYDLNIYRGCSHACQYCYARYSHQYFENSRFDEDIYIKVNIVEKLEALLKSPRWKHEVINLGGVSDSYQVAEVKYKIMPEILRLLIKYKTPCIICTKSDLILRDIDLIKELADITYVNIACTITTNEEEIQKNLEPGAVLSERRWQALKMIKEKTNASVGVHLMPLIPYLTDQPLMLESIYKKAKDINVDYVLPGLLYLRGITRPHFLDFVQECYPQYYSNINFLYQNKEEKNKYKKQLYSLINSLEIKYQISSNYNINKNEKLREPIQIQFEF